MLLSEATDEMLMSEIKRLNLEIEQVESHLAKSKDHHAQLTANVLEKCASGTKLSSNELVTYERTLDHLNSVIPQLEHNLKQYISTLDFIKNNHRHKWYVKYIIGLKYNKWTKQNYHAHWVEVRCSICQVEKTLDLEMSTS